MDPLLQISLRFALALLLASAAAHKLRDPARFRSVLEGYDVMPLALAGLVAPLVAVIEAALAASLFAGLAPASSATAVAALMLAYAAAIERNVARGRTDIDCGCMGPSARVPLGRELVVRNVVLAAAAAAMALPVSPRPLVWLDVLGVAAAVAAMAACWLAGERLLALAPRAAALRRALS